MILLTGEPKDAHGPFVKAENEEAALCGTDQLARHPAEEWNTFKMHIIPAMAQGRKKSRDVVTVSPHCNALS